ncbi:hypothetical protein MYXO_01153 [Myxococcaceae bacterium]|jgi:hypothetical protein|nr:hypothetical protein MYXO_01153 [Myxococcaceae bacterium]
MTDETLFPSTQWFEALARGMERKPDAFRSLGSVDCTMVVKVELPAGSELYEVAFEGFAARSVRRLAGLADAAPGHFVLEASLRTWRDMIENIRTHGGPDLTHTLNYLTFPDDPMRVSGPDQLEVDAFYRYNESLQRYFNGAADLPTRYPSQA